MIFRAIFAAVLAVVLGFAAAPLVVALLGSTYPPAAYVFAGFVPACAWAVFRATR